MYISYLSGIQIFIPIKAWYYVISAKYAEQIMIWICQRHYLGYTLYIAYLFCFVFFGCGHIITYADSWSISHTF